MLTNVNAFPTVGVKNLNTARDFYEKKLGLKPIGESNDEVQLFKAGNGLIEIYKSQYAGTNKATSLSWEVKEIEKEVKELKEKGVTFEHYELPDMKVEGDLHVSDDFKVAWFKDPDGNILCLHNQ